MHFREELKLIENFGTEWIAPQMFKLLPKRHIFFELVIRFNTNRKHAFFCIF